MAILWQLYGNFMATLWQLMATYGNWQLYGNFLWHLFMCCMFQVKPVNAKKITKATVVLHNILRDRNPNIQNGELDEEAEDGTIIPGAWRDAGVMREVEAVGRGP